ncbi:hypothetical protein [Pedobacter steynii]
MENQKGRSVLIEHASTLSIVKDGWKYIEPHAGPANDKLVGIELGNLNQPQLYNLKTDESEKNNLASQYPDKVKMLKDLLTEIKDKR